MIIYKTTNLINGKIYVGKYEGNRDNYIGSGYILKKAIKKYGVNNFKREVIETCYSVDILQEREKFWIKKLDATNPKVGYNIAEGGNGGNTFYGKSEDEMKIIKDKISNSGKNRLFTDEHRKKLSDAASKRKNKIVSKQKGMTYEEYFGEDKAAQIKDKIRKTLAGRKMPDEIRLKISNSTKGKILGPMGKEHIENLKKSFINRDEKRKKNTIDNYIKLLDDFLLNGVNEENVNYARRVYQKAIIKGIDISKYTQLVNFFKRIEFERRSKRRKKTS